MTNPAPHAARSRKRARIIRFPVARQCPFFSKRTRKMAPQMRPGAERTLRTELQRRIDALHRQGVSDQAVEREVRALESAVRSDLWRLVLLPDVPDGAA